MDFEQNVLSQLTVIRCDGAVTAEKISRIEQHLGTLNGKVLKLTDANTQRIMDLKDHESSCPVSGRLMHLERYEVETSTRSKANSKWLSVLAPEIWVICGAGVTILMLHASSFLPSVK